MSAQLPEARFVALARRSRRWSVTRPGPTLHKVIMDTLTDGVIFLDARGVAVECNRSAARILGVQREEIIGRTSIDPSLFAAIHEDGTPIRDDEHPSRVVLRTGRPCTDVVQGVLRTGGEVLWIHITAMPVPGPGGAIRGVVVSIHDITPLKRLEARLREEAIRDELTGLYNRRYLMDQIGRAQNAARRHHHGLCLCICDLDHFKDVNDTYGHGVGDLALCAFAQLLATHLRQEDVAARFGGDEFCLLFTHSAAEGARIVLERMREAVKALAIPNGAETLSGLSASFGLAQHREGLETPAQLLEAADQALYRAKNQGRDCVVIAS